jgi:hypothetical protein
MNINQKFPTVISVFFFMALWTPLAHAGWHDAPVVYQQAVTKILQRGDISWGSKSDDYYRFGYVAVSHDGNKVLFTGACEFCDTAEVRPFLVNPDGTGLQDISDMLPDDIANRWSGWRNLIINDEGTKVFFRAVVEAGYYDDEYLYAYDVGSGTTQLAVAKEGGFSPLASNWLFRIDTAGSKVYLDKYNAGYDSALQKERKGLFYADTGGPMQWYMDLDDLPCESQCGNMNLFGVMGVSARNDRIFFQWNSDYDRTDGSDQNTRVYYAGLDGLPVPLTDGHWDIYDGDRRGITDTDGTRVIYRYIQQYGDPQKLALVDVASKTSREIAWTSGLNGFDAHLSRSGRYALVNGEYGDHGTYYKTLLDLDTDTARDTWSYHIKMSQWGSTSNLTGNDRYYFYTIDGPPNSAENVGLYRIDTQTTGDDKAPYVQAVAFSAPALLDMENETIAVQVTVSHPQGTSRVDSVTLLPLVEGQEYPAWSMGREPLAFPTGDPGSVLLYDDGTNGDVTAGDGIYTFDRIATRKNDRQEGGWNTWYGHYPLPADLGIRLVVRDLDNNYAIADTTLQITDDPNDLLQLQDTIILTSSSPNHTAASGSDEKVYGTSTPNEITLMSGAKAELINFPGNNTIFIQSGSDVFSVSRSGAVVTFTGEEGTVLKMPATRDVQTIYFNNQESRVLQIHDNHVKLNDQEITGTAAAIHGG